MSILVFPLHKLFAKGFWLLYQTYSIQQVVKLEKNNVKPGLHMNGMRSHAHALTHAISLIRCAIIIRHGFKYFTYYYVKIYKVVQLSHAKKLSFDFMA